VLLGGRRDVVVIEVAERNDLAPGGGNPGDMRPAPAADPDNRDVVVMEVAERNDLAPGGGNPGDMRPAPAADPDNRDVVVMEVAERNDLAPGGGNPGDMRPAPAADPTMATFTVSLGSLPGMEPSPACDIPTNVVASKWRRPKRRHLPGKHHSCPAPAGSRGSGWLGPSTPQVSFDSNSSKGGMILPLPEGGSIVIG
jgi:hypothetical protein